MKKLFVFVLSLLGAFVLGTNFHLEFNLSVGLLRSSGLRRMINKMQDRWAQEEKPVTLSRADGWGIDPTATGLRPPKPAILSGCSWDSVKGRWLPPGLKHSPTGGYVWPVGKTEFDWDYANGAWKKDALTPKPFNGNLFPKKEVKPVGFGRGFQHPNAPEDDDDDIDDENDPL